MSILSQTIKLAYENPHLRGVLIPLVSDELGSYKLRIILKKRASESKALWDKLFGSSRLASNFRAYYLNDPEGLIRATTAKGAVFEDPNTEKMNSLTTTYKKAIEGQDWALQVINELYKKFEVWYEENASEEEKEEVEKDFSTLLLSEIGAMSQAEYRELKRQISEMDWSDALETPLKLRLSDLAIDARSAMSYGSLIRRDGKGLKGFAKKLADGMAFSTASRFERLGMLGVLSVDQVASKTREFFWDTENQNSVIADLIVWRKRQKWVSDLMEEGRSDDEIERELVKKEDELRRELDKSIGTDSLKKYLAEEMAHQTQKLLFGEIFKQAGLEDALADKLGFIPKQLQHLPMRGTPGMDLVLDYVSKYITDKKIEGIVAASGMKHIYARVAEKGFDRLEEAGYEDVVDVIRTYFRETSDFTKGGRAQTVADVNNRYQTQMTGVIKKIDSARSTEDLLEAFREMNDITRSYFSQGLAEIDKTKERYSLTNRLEKLKPKSESLMDDLVISRVASESELDFYEKSSITWLTLNRLFQQALFDMSISENQESLLKEMKKVMPKNLEVSGEDVKEAFLKVIEVERNKKNKKKSKGTAKKKVK